ncbi:hypothetical protein MKW94_009954, partial [Papaver nudicaule]|nr:hypothetical protein [Papaver nudicaule]
MLVVRSLVDICTYMILLAFLICSIRMTVLSLFVLSKVWWNDVLSSSIQTDTGANLALAMDGRWLFMGGWNKIVNVQELSCDELRINVRPIGSIPCDSVVTALSYREGKLYVGFADSIVK